MHVSKLYIPAFAMLAFGYPLTAVALSLAGEDFGASNTILKASYAALFLLSLVGAILRRQISPSRELTPLFIFFILLGFRLVYDLFIIGIYSPHSSPSYVFGYYFALTLFPMMVISLCFESEDLPALHRWILGVLMLSCAMVAVQFMQSGSQFLTALEAQRLEIREKDEAAAVLNPITVGLCGAVLAMMSLATLAVRMKRNVIQVMTLVAGVVLGLGALMLAGSRGPFAAFVCGFLFFLFGTIRAMASTRELRRNVPRSGYLLLIGAVVVTLIYVAQSGDNMFLAIRRLTETTALMLSGSTDEIRVYILADGVAEFMSSPLLGSGHLALQGTAYPHNSLLEAFMTTGLFGGFLFVAILVRLFALAWRGVTMQICPIAYTLAPIAIVVIIMSMFSFSISQSPEIWLCVSLYMTIAGRAKNRYTQSTRMRPKAPDGLMHQLG